MKNIFKFLLSLTLILSLHSCEKPLSTKISEFVSLYNSSTKQVANPVLEDTSAEKTGDKEITIRLYVSIAKDDPQLEMIKVPLAQSIAVALNSEKSINELVEDGVNFKIKVIDKDGQLQYTEIYDKSKFQSLGKIDLNPETGTSTEDLNKILDIYNKNLPQEDPSTGIKITKIEAGNNHDIIYSAEVPDELKEVLKLNNAKTLMKDEMLRQPQIQNIFSSVSELGIDKLRYLYKDKNGNTVSEIVLSKEDIK